MAVTAARAIFRKSAAYTSLHAARRINAAHAISSDPGPGGLRKQQLSAAVSSCQGWCHRSPSWIPVSERSARISRLHPVAAPTWKGWTSRPMPTSNVSGSPGPCSSTPAQAMGPTTGVWTRFSRQPCRRAGFRAIDLPSDDGFVLRQRGAPLIRVASWSGFSPAVRRCHCPSTLKIWSIRQYACGVR